MDKAQRKMTILRMEENQNEKQKANGFTLKLKVKVEELDRDGDLTITYKRLPSRVKPEKLNVPYDFEIEYGSFTDKAGKSIIFERILGFVIADKK
jgi:hypothetical protein